MRIIFQVLFVLVIGFALGGTSAWYSIQRSHGIGAININEWTAWPFSGGSEADPYTVARVIADSTIPLGAAEGLAFEAREDSTNRQLILECNYMLEGSMPKARLWTLTPYRLDGKPIKVKDTQNLIPAHTNSTRILRFGDNSFRIALGPDPRAGNWLATQGKGPFRLVMRLYDTPITSNAGLVDPIMPKIIRLECRS